MNCCIIIWAKVAIIIIISWRIYRSFFYTQTGKVFMIGVQMFRGSSSQFFVKVQSKITISISITWPFFPWHPHFITSHSSFFSLQKVELGLAQMYCHWVPVQICRIWLFEFWYLRAPTLLKWQMWFFSFASASSENR